MSWRLLQGRGGVHVDLGYSIQSAGTKKQVGIQFTISEAIMHRCVWSDSTRVQLMVNEEERLGRLQEVEKDGRKLSVIGVNGRSHCRFVWLEDVAEFFPDLCCVTSLEVTEAGRDGITFQLPEKEGEK